MKNMSDAYDRIYNNRENKEVPQSPFQYSLREPEDDRQRSKDVNRSIQVTKQDDPSNTTKMRFVPQRRTDNQIGSVPLIFTPPPVEGQQIKQSSSKSQSKGKTSNMRTPFSPMLDESPSLPSEDYTEQAGIKTNEETADKNEDFSKNEESSSSRNEESSSSENKESSSSQNEQSSSGEKEESSSKENEQSKKEKEESSSEDRTKSTKEESPSLIDEYTAMLTGDINEESPSSLEESSSSQDETFSLMTESTPERLETLTMKEESSSVNLDFSAMLEESSSESSAISDVKGESSPESADFSDMLEESSSVEVNTAFMQKPSAEAANDSVSSIDENQQSEEESSGGSTLTGEFSDLLKKAYSILDENKKDSHKGTESIQNDSKTMNKESSSLQNEFFSLLSDDHSTSDDSSKNESSSELENMKHDHSERLHKVSTLLQKFSDMMDESESKQENTVFDQLESSSEDEFPVNSKEESSSHQESQPFNLDESSSSVDIFEEKSSPKEESENGYFPSIKEQDCSPKENLPTVKLPVLLAKLNFDINVFDSFPLHLPVGDLTKLEWSLQSLKSCVILPSSVVFLKGVLIADIQYVKNSNEKTLHSVKIPVPWEKTVNIDWLHPPVMPAKNIQKEFMFKDHDGSLDSYFEHSQAFTEQVESQLSNINFVWHEELNNITKSNLEIQGRANVSIDLLQKQYINLHSSRQLF